MLKHGLLFIALTFLSSDTASFSAPELRELSVTEGEPLRILGRLQYDRKDCRPIRTQAGIWGDSVEKAPLNPRARLGLGVGLQERAQNLWSRKCVDEAFEFYDKAAKAYWEVIQLSAGDPSIEGRTFRLQARMNIATVYIQLGEFDGARVVLNATLAERDAYLPAITRLAEVEMRSGNPIAALAVTDRLRGKDFEDIAGLSIGQFWALRAQAHCQLGDVPQANWEIEKARRNDPNVIKAQCRITKGD